MVFFWITILSCDFIGNKCFDHFYRIKSAKKYDNIPWEIVVKKGTFSFCCQLTGNDVCKECTLYNNKTKAVGLAVTFIDNSSMLPYIDLILY